MNKQLGVCVCVQVRGRYWWQNVMIFFVQNWSNKSSNRCPTWRKLSEKQHFMPKLWQINGNNQKSVSGSIEIRRDLNCRITLNRQTFTKIVVLIQVLKCISNFKFQISHIYKSRAWKVKAQVEDRKCNWKTWFSNSQNCQTVLWLSVAYLDKKMAIIAIELDTVKQNAHTHTHTLETSRSFAQIDRSIRTLFRTNERKKRWRWSCNTNLPTLVT